jgi:hypothetical protein
MEQIAASGIGILCSDEEVLKNTVEKQARTNMLAATSSLPRLQASQTYPVASTNDRSPGSHLQQGARRHQGQAQREAFREREQGQDLLQERF